MKTPALAGSFRLDAVAFASDVGTDLDRPGSDVAAPGPPRAQPRPDAPDPADAAAAVARTSPGFAGPRLSAGVLRQEIQALLATLPADARASREDRVARWVFAGELRKLAALDEYMSGFLRG
ncbi:MAG: hypothetical protein MUE98_01005 [Rhodobacteraceae bacterium]|jgi:hypothetical protein|nr:hypothetical protein [Paracoccaceae bacterium]